ncbi:flagella basal body P-ring formation protein FlgA, partial [Puniceicoccales bacterium CK1056]
MIKLSMIFWALFLGSVAFAESVVPTRTIRADAEIGAKDVTLKEVSNPSAYTRLADVIGQEARVTLYAGRPILFDDIGPPAVVARNQI